VPDRWKESSERPRREAGVRAPPGVRVNAVAPGPTLTTTVEAWQDHIAPILAAIPSRRASSPEKVARGVVFLASEDASNIHGAILSVDGGRAAA
jgi:NAD(P)-dependent dehydrogenase (short-subunit alcohol dehydrogenase family)